jgi:hypothetical protein
MNQTLEPKAKEF